MADVFISYSKARAAEAKALAGELSDLGFDVWWDTSLLPTGSFEAEINRQLDAAKAVIVIWSPQSVESLWVKSEAGHGLRQGKLVSTHTADLDKAAGLPKPYDQIHCVEIADIRAIVGALDRLKVPRSGGRAAPVARAPAASAADGDDRLFAEVERAGTAAAYEYYLRELPEGRHARVARFRLSGLRPAPPPDRSAEGRIKLDCPPGLAHGAPDGWFLPGAGKAEWFQDIAGGPEMVVVPKGRFMMGSPEDEPGRESLQKGTESPQHEVLIPQDFAVGRHAVTRGQFAAFVKATGHKAEGAQVWKADKETWEFDANGSWRNPGFTQDDSHPAVCVIWDDAKAYATWLAEATGNRYRLLSEAEWEYCCRAGTTTPFWWGSTIAPAQANYAGNSVYAGGGSTGEHRKRTVPVGSFAANAWGLYQVHGNTWEWCEDIWHNSYQADRQMAPSDGSAWLQGGDASRRVLRGGSWGNYPRVLRAANRNGGTTDVPSNFLGFRVGRTL